jgi:hypothetical protein
LAHHLVERLAVVLFARLGLPEDLYIEFRFHGLPDFLCDHIGRQSLGLNGVVAGSPDRVVR